MDIKDSVQDLAILQRRPSSFTTAATPGKQKFQPQPKFVRDAPAIVNDLFRLVCHMALLDSHMSTSYYSVRVKVLGYALTTAEWTPGKHQTPPSAFDHRKS